MKASLPPITPELIRAALAHIPASLPRDEWARVGMAIKSEYPDDTGLQLFTDWSATAEDHDAASTRSTWRSIKAGGGVKIGTLLHLAKEHGFTLPKGDQGGPAPAAPDAEALAQRERDRAAQREADAAAEREGHARAADEAFTQWHLASERGASPYLARKGVEGHGVRYGADGWLLVPLRDGEGKLWNLQRIAPEKPGNGGPDKLFLKGGRKSGLWHLIGPLAGADVLLLAEGYATGASLLQATGRPVAIAFDAGNLLHVARALRQHVPGMHLLVCGDDDAATEQRTSRNPGREKAEAAARAVHGGVVFPQGLPEGASDFNDLHRAQGLDAVRGQVEAAVAALLARQPTGGMQAPGDEPHEAPQDGPGTAAGAAVDAGEGAGPPAPPRKRQRAASRAARQPDASASAPAAEPAASDPFTCDAHGVWFHGRDREGNPTRPLFVCSPLTVAARTRDQTGGGWGYLMEFPDPAGRPKQWAMPARMLSGDGGEYRAALLGMGLLIGAGASARNRLTEYIQTRQPEEFATCTDRIGWHPTADGGMAYVLPHETIGAQAERIVFQSDNQMENTFRVQGEAAAWRERVGALCAGNSRLVFAVSCAFAGPLLKPAGVESGGFHLRGGSSSGKTTSLRIAASVFGGPDYMQLWRTTDNALEPTAAQHCDALLILDELAQVDGKAAGECAYLLANERSKARSNRSSAPRPRLSWRLLFLSSGELGLADHMAESGKRARTGQEVRMIDIPADAGAGMGTFETFRDFAGMGAYASHLTREAARCYGAAGRAWMGWACAHSGGLGTRVRKAMSTLTQAWVPTGASGQVERVAARFALVAVAGAMATEAGLTGWPEGEAERAARACFDAWMQARGGAGNGEVTAMLRQARRFFELNGEGRFTWWHRAADDHNAKTLMRAGFRRLLGMDGKPIKTNGEHQREYGERMQPFDGEASSVEYFVLPEVFRSEVCQGFDYQAMCRALLERGCLQPDKGRPFDCKPRLPGIGPTACYRVTSELMALDL